jgi:NAD(P) transhydrogenase
MAAEDITTMLAVSSWAGAAIGGISFTGSLVAFGKLHGIMGSAALKLAGKNQINMGLSGLTLASGALMCINPDLGVPCLLVTSAASGALGAPATPPDSY